MWYICANGTLFTLKKVMGNNMDEAEGTPLGEIKQTENDKHCTVSFICGL